jgi:hypothetical protein
MPFKKCSHPDCSNPNKDVNGLLDTKYFQKDVRKSDEHAYTCTWCTNLSRRLRYKNVPEVKERRNKEAEVWVLANPERSKAIQHNFNNSEHGKALKELNRLKNIENFKVSQKRYKDANPEKRRAQVVRWKKEHPEEAKARSNHNTSMRRSRKRHATLPWLNKDMKLQIRRIYAGCPAGYHVDHIIPLKAVNPSTREHVASGLHVPWNLQYLTAHDNESKQNKLPVIK